MKHKAQVSTFGRRTDARKALIRGLVISLVEHGRIKTTVAKAKELRRHAERAITMAKSGSLHARRLLLSRYPNRATVAKMMDEIAPNFKNRPGGYTRIIKTGPRPGDKAEMAFIEWVNFEFEAPAASDAKGAKAEGKKAAGADGEKSEKTAKKAAGKTTKKAAGGAKKKATTKKAAKEE